MPEAKRLIGQFSLNPLAKGGHLFGIGSAELLVILVVALIVLGPKSLATVSRSLGKAMGEFRRVSTDFQRTLNVEAAEQEAKEARKRYAEKQMEEKRKAAQSAANDSATPKEDVDVPADHDASGAASAVASEEAGPPPDSPLGQAIAKAKAQAAANSSLPPASSIAANPAPTQDKPRD